MARREFTITRISPLSAFRVGLAFSVVGLIAWLLAVSILYFGMDQAGIWDSINGLVSEVGGTSALSYGIVLSVAALLGAVCAVSATILAPLLALIYNAVVSLFGGLEIEWEEELHQ